MDTISKITGIGVYTPERKITNEDVLAILRDSSSAYLSDGDLSKLLERAQRNLSKAGNVTRYWCRENQYCTDIARIASERALGDAGVKPEEIDMIIFTGMSKAFVEPASAHVLRCEIGAFNANVIDTQDACTSFVKSLELANSLIRVGSYRKILIAAGERTYDWADFTCKTVDELAWKFGSLTIGDAAGAMVVEATDDPSYTQDHRHMRFFYRLANDASYALCHIGLNHRVGERYRLFSHSSRLVKLGLQMIMELLIERLMEDEWKNFMYDNLFVHDIGRTIDDLVLPFLKQANIHVPDNYRSFFPEYGNVACVSLPLGMWLAREEGRLKRGNIGVFISLAAGVQAGVMVFKY